MHLSRDSACAVHIVLHLATQEGGAAGTRAEIADACGLSEAVLAGILPKLAEAHIIRRHDGPSERFTLCRPPEETTLLAIVEAIEGEEASDLLLPGPVEATEQEPRRSSLDRPAWRRVRSVAASVLSGRTIADLLHSAGRAKR